MSADVRGSETPAATGDLGGRRVPRTPELALEVAPPGHLRTSSDIFLQIAVFAVSGLATRVNVTTSPLTGGPAFHARPFPVSVGRWVRLI
jgi:hypothetical protein